MKIFDDLLNPSVAKILLAGGVGVLRTDTLYGLVCLATNEAAVERVFTIKSRDEVKSPIVLVSDIAQLFDVPSELEQTVLKRVWPGKTSVILSSKAAPAWIKRGNGSVAYRLPDSSQLQQLLNTTGPLIAPSANPQSEPPAQTVQQAIEYFGDTIDFYVDGGEVIDTKPSELIRVHDSGTVERLR